MMKYIITASCNPYNARTHYNGQKVLRRDMMTPTKWVKDDAYGEGLTLEEAMDILDDYANSLNDDTVYYDDEFVKQMVEEAKEYDEVDLDISWYQGAGWYENNVLVYKHGDMYLRDDVVDYAIEEMSSYAADYDE